MSAATSKPGVRVEFRHRSKTAALMACLVAALPAIAAEIPRILMTQPAQADGTALPRPLIGAASPDAAILPFHVALSYGCPAPDDRPQIFVSIGDSWRLQDASDLPTPLIIRVDVPIRQLQWLMQPDAECTHVDGKIRPDDVDAGGIRYYRLPARAAGFATLTCVARDGAVRAATATSPLDVWLSCPAPAEASPPP